MGSIHHKNILEKCKLKSNNRNSDINLRKLEADYIIRYKYFKFRRNTSDQKAIQM